MDNIKFNSATIDLDIMPRPALVSLLTSHTALLASLSSQIDDALSEVNYTGILHNPKWLRRARNLRRDTRANLRKIQLKISQRNTEIRERNAIELAARRKSKRAKRTVPYYFVDILREKLDADVFDEYMAMAKQQWEIANDG